MQSHVLPTRLPARLATPLASLLFAAMVLLVHPGTASAQISSVEPYWAVVTVDATTLHAGDMPLYYAVARVNAGQVLRVDGAGGGWARVAYPRGVTGFADPRNVRTVSETSLEVTRPTPLKAANLERGFGGSWQNLLAESDVLTAGDTLTYTDTVKRSDGTVAAYVVIPPPTARAYVEASLLRRATEAEIAAHTSPNQPPQEPEATQAEPAQPETAPAGAEAAAGAPADAATPAQPEVISLLDEMAIASPDAPAAAETTAAAPADAAPARAPERVRDAERVVTDTEVTVPAVDNPPIRVVPAETTEATPSEAAGEVAAATGAQAALEGGVVPAQTDGNAATQEQLETMIDAGLDIQALESSFDQVRRQPLMQAELGELRDQFQRVRNSLTTMPADVALAQRIDQRLAVLDVMIDLRDRQRELAERRAQLDSTTVTLRQQIENAEARATFTVVGRLVPSVIYDGQRLPKLYRVVSIDQVGTRTIAYVADDEDLELAQKVGRVVGMSGPISIDPTLGVRLISSQRAVVLQPGG